MTALSILQDAATRLGISKPLTVFSNTDDAVVQLRALLNQEGMELGNGAGQGYAWTKLITEKTFTTTAAAIQASSIATDFNWYLNDTMWNRTTMIKMYGPVSAEEWQRIQAITQVSLPAAYFRFRGGNILIYPSPTVGQTAAYEYVSSYWCQNSSAVGATSMSADDDTAIIGENLITLGVIWRYLKAKGLDYAEDFRTYQIEVGKAMARDGGKAKRGLHGPTQSQWNANIAEGSWAL